jgi:GDP-4-dehydro-6-deoxy-D-mannose reductase
MPVLITGGAGFVGQWLARALLERGDEVVLGGIGGSFDGPNILTPDERARTRWISLDVRDAKAVVAAIADAAPSIVFHLAGMSFPPDADRAPIDAYDVNTLGVVRLLDAVRRANPSATTLVVGTSVQYGFHAASEMPLPESAEQRPATTYAGSKAAQEVAALQFARAHDIRVVCTRSFNHSGAGHGPQYLVPSLVARVRAIARGEERVLRLGNDVVRDYLHIDDVVRAYLALAERGRAGEVYNVCSGVGVSSRKLAADVLLHAGVTADISIEPSLVRASDIPVLVGSPEKLARDTDWSPTKTTTDIIADLLNASTE